MPYILMSHTDGTGTPHPQACVVIRSVRVQYEPPNNAGELGINIYHDVAAYTGGKEPIESYPPKPLTTSEIEAYVGTFAGTAYGIIHARPEFSSGTIVA